MSLASLLLQPQILDRLNALQADEAFADDAVALLQRVFAEPANLVTIAPAFAKSFETMGQRLWQQIEPRFDQVGSSLHDLLKPILDQANALATQSQQAVDSSEMLEMICGLLETAGNALAALDEPSLRSYTRRIETLISDTLGLNQTLMQEELRQVYATSRAELLIQLPTLEPKQAAVVLAMISFLGRVEQQFFTQIPKLDLHPDRIAQKLLQQLNQTGFEQWRGKIACLLEKQRTLLQSGQAIMALVKPSSFGPASGGAAEVRPPLTSDRYCWYATWVYASKRRTMLPEPSRSFWPTVGHLTLWGISNIPGFPHDEVWLSSSDAEHPGAQLQLRRAFWDDAVLHQASGDFSWNQAPQFTTTSGKESITFAHFSPQFLESWTQISAGVLELIKTAGHIAGAATEQSYVTNIPLALWNPLRAASTAFAGAPLPSYLNHRLGWSITTEALLFSPIPLLAGLLGYAETVDKSKKIDALDTLLATSPEPLKSDGAGLLSELNEGVLALFTLLNYQGAGSSPAGEETRPFNRESDGPIVDLINSLALYILKAATSPETAKELALKNGVFWLYLLVHTPVVCATTALVSTLICWTIAQAVTIDQIWKNPAKQAGLSMLKFFLGNVTGPEEPTPP